MKRQTWSFDAVCDSCREVRAIRARRRRAELEHPSRDAFYLDSTDMEAS